jgi:hypothetical protein
LDFGMTPTFQSEHGLQQPQPCHDLQLAAFVRQMRSAAAALLTMFSSGFRLNASFPHLRRRLLGRHYRHRPGRQSRGLGHHFGAQPFPAMGQNPKNSL